MKLLGIVFIILLSHNFSLNVVFLFQSFLANIVLLKEKKLYETKIIKQVGTVFSSVSSFVGNPVAKLSTLKDDGFLLKMFLLIDVLRFLL